MLAVVAGPMLVLYIRYRIMNCRMTGRERADDWLLPPHANRCAGLISDMDIDKLAWICITGRRVLFARSRGRQTAYLPGGKREPGETDEAALVREIREELTVRLVAGSLRLEGVFRAPADGQAPGAMVTLRCYAADFEGAMVDIRPSAEIEEILWYSHAERDRCSAAGQLVLDWLKECGRIN